MMTTTPFHIKPGMEPIFRSIYERLTTTGGRPIELITLVQSVPHRSWIKKVIDWFSGVTYKEDTTYVITSNDTVLLDGRLDVDEIAHQLKRIIAPNDVMTLTDIDESSGDVTAYTITDKLIISAS